MLPPHSFIALSHSNKNAGDIQHKIILGRSHNNSSGIGVNELGDKFIKDTSTLLDEKNKRLESLKKDVDTLSVQTFIEEKRIKEPDSEKSSLTIQLKVYENRKKLLTDLQNEYEGYSYAIKKILKESDKNSEIKKLIVGVVASLIKVPAKYETAIEVALGGAVQNIVTYNEEGAKKLIDFLKQNSFGRATFLPITSMKRREFDQNLIKGVQGCYGLASSLVDFDSKIESVVSNLLGSTVVVDNMNTAISLAKS